MTRRILALVLLLTMLAVPAKAATNLSTTTCPGAGCSVQNVTGSGSVGIQVTGTFSGTLAFEASIDGTNFSALSVTPLNGGSTVTTTTSTGFWTVTTSGIAYVRVRFSAYTSGTASVSTAISQARTGTGSSSGAPADATYITQVANSTLSAEQALGALASGIMRVATTTGAITALTDSAGIAANVSDETGTGVLVFGTAPTFTTSATSPLLIGGTGTTSTLTLKTTTGVGTTNADIIFLVGNNGATEAARILNSGFLGVGCTVPGNVVDICSNGGGPLFLHRYSSDTGAASMVGFKARGDKTTPTAVQANDQLSLFTARGYQTATNAFSAADVGRVGFYATQNFTDANMGTGFQVQITPTNSTTVATVLNLTSTSFTVTGSITPASTGTRYLCISTTGVVQSSASACSGT